MLVQNSGLHIDLLYVNVHNELQASLVVQAACEEGMKSGVYRALKSGIVVPYILAALV